MTKYWYRLKKQQRAMNAEVNGKPVIFLHPKEFNGTLIELEEN